MDFDITIIGAGVVGLAIAAKLSQENNKLVVVEKYEKFGQETSSRNSEVIHSGIYYPQNSLKAELCILGRKKLYEFCDKFDIPFKKCGKYIVATNEQERKKLNDIVSNAKKNGIENARIIEKAEIKKAEPNVNAFAAAFFADSGIIDSHSFMKKLETQILNNKADIAYNSEVKAIEKIKEGYKIIVNDENSDFSFTSKTVINAAGLFADKISSMIGLDNPKYKIYFWKGEYFSVGNGKNKMINSLIYPVPGDKASLGIHTVSDLGRGLKLGPNATFIPDNIVDYKVNSEKKQAFYESVKKFLPFIEIDDLFPDQAGIRPKLTANNKEFRDFIIKNETNAGFKNFINLIGIESPGLTASLAIAEYVKSIII